jgi:hypothetical protein
MRFKARIRNTLRFNMSNESYVFRYGDGEEGRVVEAAYEMAGRDNSSFGETEARIVELKIGRGIDELVQ